jgi:hypothetical protein
MRKRWTFVIIFAATGFAIIGYLVWHGLKEVATLEPGMIALQLPSGATAYLRRQAYFGKPAEIYLSANGDFCAPYDRWHDYKLPEVIQGGSESPVLISYSGNTVIVHSPKQLKRPWLAGPSSFIVAFQQLTPEAYSEYAGAGRSAAGLPSGWMRVEVPFGHNLCAL